jgi:hypothetical protein
MASRVDSVGSEENAFPRLASSVMLGYNDIPAMFQSDVAAGTFVLQLFQAEVRMRYRATSLCRLPGAVRQPSHTTYHREREDKPGQLDQR